jgi:hypothetical protein
MAPLSPVASPAASKLRPAPAPPGQSSAASRPPGVVNAMSPDDFVFLKVLGKGSFGKVLLAEHKQSRDVFAVKVSHDLSQQ